MPKPEFVAIAAVTLDGKIARGPSHPSTWTSTEDKKILRRELDRCDLIVLGRHTFDTLKCPNPKRRYLVLTGSVKSVELKAKNVWFFNPAKTHILGLVKSLGGGRIGVLGGTQTYDWFLQQNLLNEIFLTIEPLVFGGGLPLFSKSTKTRRFHLASTTKLNRSGSLLLHYKKSQKSA